MAADVTSPKSGRTSSRRAIRKNDSYSFVGPVIYDGEKYEKLDVDDLIGAPFKVSLAGGWLATIQHHFLSAIIPASKEVVSYQVSYDGKTTLLSAIG